MPLNSILNNTQNQPLHNAVLAGYFQEVNHLLHEGADPNVLNAAGQTPFHLLFTNAVPHPPGVISSEITAFLAHGADYSLKDQAGYAPYQLAMRSPHFDWNWIFSFIPYIVKKAASVNDDLVLLRPIWELRKAAIIHGAHPKIVDHKLLNYAIQFGSESIALMNALLQKNIVNKNTIKHYINDQYLVSLVIPSRDTHFAQWLVDNEIIPNLNGLVIAAIEEEQFDLIRDLLISGYISPFVIYLFPIVSEKNILQLIDLQYRNGGSSEGESFKNWFKQWISRLIPPSILSINAGLAWILQCQKTFPELVSTIDTKIATITHLYIRQQYKLAEQYCCEILKIPLSDENKNIYCWASLTMARMLYEGHIGYNAGRMMQSHNDPLAILHRCALHAYAYLIELIDDKNTCDTAIKNQIIALHNQLTHALARELLEENPPTDPNSPAPWWSYQAIHLASSPDCDKKSFPQSLLIKIIQQQQHQLKKESIHSSVVFSC